MRDVPRHAGGWQLKDAVIRRATSADIPAMSQIRLAVRENVLSDPGRITVQMYQDYLEKLGRGWVAELNGTIVAFCYADREHASIWALFVQPGFEGNGFAKRLLKLAVDWLFELGHQSVELDTTPDTRADRFYVRQGWTRGVASARSVPFRLSRTVAKTHA